MEMERIYVLSKLSATSRDEVKVHTWRLEMVPGISGKDLILLREMSRISRAGKAVNCKSMSRGPDMCFKVRRKTHHEWEGGE